MAIGDVKSGMTNIAQGGSYTIQPPAGEEWVIHNIYYQQGVAFRVVSGAGVLLFDSDTSAGARLGVCFHLTNSQYMVILNSYAGTNLVAYDGIQTK